MKSIFLCFLVICFYTIANCMASDILYLKYPSGGEQLTVNNTYTIEWEIEDSS